MFPALVVSWLTRIIFATQVTLVNSQCVCHTVDYQDR
jgi:hypothetical protein